MGARHHLIATCSVYRPSIFIQHKQWSQLGDLPLIHLLGLGATQDLLVSRESSFAFLFLSLQLFHTTYAVQKDNEQG